MEVRLLGKTELWIQDIKLQRANLSDIAVAVAGVLGLKDDEVLVVDAGLDHLTLDILRTTLQVDQFIGKERELLSRLSKIAELEVTADTSLHSDGILEMITLDEELTGEVAARTESMSRQVEDAFMSRVKVFPTGGEVLNGAITDTNSPLIKQELEKSGYRVSIGETIPDEEAAIAGIIETEIDRGYGVIITTGGVGAEAKDRTIEATERLDPEAAVQWIVKYQKQGRHVKEGVRIGVGKVGKALVINLPGPTDEVESCLEVIRDTLGSKCYDKETIASRLAARLKTKLVRRHEHG